MNNIIEAAQHSVFIDNSRMTSVIERTCLLFMDIVMPRLAQKRNIYKGAKLHRIGSMVSNTNCAESDVDFILEISRFVTEGEQSGHKLFHFEYVEGKDNLRFVCNSENEKITTDTLYKDLESDLHEILDREPDLVVSQNWNHGGFAANDFSGVRCNGPAVTLLFKSEGNQDITCDLTIGLRLPEGDPAYKRVVRNVAKKLPGLEAEFSREIADKGLFAVPLNHLTDTDEWSVSSAVIEPWLVNQLEGDVKEAIREVKEEKPNLNVEKRHLNAGVSFNVNEYLFNEVCAYRRNKDSVEYKRKDLSRQLSRGHLYLSYEQSNSVEEPCAKHCGSINSSAIKFVAIDISLRDGSVTKYKIIEKLLKGSLKDLLLERDIPSFTVPLYANEVKKCIVGMSFYKLRKFLNDAIMDGKHSVDPMDTSENVDKGTATVHRMDFSVFDAASYREHQEKCRQQRVATKEEPQAHKQNESSHPVTKVYIEGLTSYSGVDSDYDIKSFNSVKGKDWDKKDHSAQSDAREAWRTSEAIKIELHTTLQGITDLAAWIRESDLFECEFSVSTVKLFADHNSSLFTIDKKGRLLLHWVACFGDESSIEMILKKGVDLNTKDKQGKVPLHYATIRRNIEIFNKLLEYGADLNAQDVLEKTPLHYLCEMVKTKKDAHGRTPLHDLTTRMLQLGVDLNTKDKQGKVPLHYATITRNIEIFNKLLEYGADLNAQDSLGKTPLHYLCEMVKTKKDAHGKTSLHDLTTQMLQLGANIGIKCKEGFTPVHSAINTDNEILDLLLEDSTKKSLITNGENHYLTFAILQGQSNKVRTLIEAGADVNGHPDDIYPPLHLATIRQEDNIINILNEKGAVVDKRDQRGKLASEYTT